MRDGPLRTTIKALSRAVWTAELGLGRALKRVVASPTWQLTDACKGCARCCEAPTLTIDPTLFYLALLRRPFVWWQRVVNGFDLVEADAEALSLTFRCAHFDWTARRCDSYHSRPGVCRDYPRALLDQAWPELFESCGHRVLLTDRQRQLDVLASQGLAPDTLARLKRQQRLE